MTAAPVSAKLGSRVPSPSPTPRPPGCAAPIRIGAALAVVAATACGAATPRAARPTLRAACAARQFWNGRACVPRPDAHTALAQGAKALAAFQVDSALALLRRALAAIPHTHRDYEKIYEQLGIAYAYLGRTRDAMRAFDMLLALDPGHLLSYTLSPKATFVFERARKQAQAETPPALSVTWPHNLEVGRPIPVDVGVIADPKHMLDRATLYVRRKGAPRYRALDMRLPPPGRYHRVELPAVRAHRPQALEVYATAFDRAGNAVLTWALPTRPRAIDLRYTPPVPWYRKWWVWAAVGGVVAAGTGTAVYLVGRSLPSTIGLGFIAP